MSWGSESSHIYMALSAITQFNNNQRYTNDYFYPVPGTGRVTESTMDVVVTFDKIGGGRVVCRRGRLSNDWDII
jgi:hypothetical protein